jgi:copper chaperone CopZ
MKKILFGSLLIFTSVVTKAQITRAELTATGLTCSMCSKATYTQLTSIPEVEKIDTDLNNTTFILYFKSGSRINVADIRKKVEDAGFSVGELLVVFSFANQKAENNSSFTQDHIKYTFMDTKPAILTGEVKVKLLDKGFLTEKEYKKLKKLSNQYPSYDTEGDNSYHIKPL